MVQYINDIVSMSLKDIELITTYKLEKSYYPLHNPGRYCHGLMFTTEGNEVYKYKDKQVSAEEGTVLFLPQGRAYDVTLNSELSCVKMINFTTHNEMKEPFIVKFKNSDIVKELFFDAERIWEKGSNTADIQCKAIFYKILYNMIVGIEAYTPEKNARKISPGVDYMLEHYLEADFRIEELSNRCLLSQRYFNLLFFNIYHCTPKEYVTLLRIKKAKELLSNKSLQVNEIAEMLGYCDGFHFSKIFKSKVGVSPIQYRHILGMK